MRTDFEEHDKLVQGTQSGWDAEKIVNITGAGLILIGTILLGIFSDSAEQVTAGIGVLGIMTGYLFSVNSSAKERRERAKKIHELETTVEAHPKDTRAVWELAKINLEGYFERNLRQVRAIFWLTVVTIGIGFTLIVFGIWRLYQFPDIVTPSIVSTVAGILINFIGATFLYLYRSVMNQAQQYVQVLERINAVGMSMYILGGLEEDGKALRQQTTAEIAKGLLKLYERK